MVMRMAHEVRFETASRPVIEGRECRASHREEASQAEQNVLRDETTFLRGRHSQGQLRE
jgi:hypothetical protein